MSWRPDVRPYGHRSLILYLQGIDGHASNIDELRMTDGCASKAEHRHGMRCAPRECPPQVFQWLQHRYFPLKQKRSPFDLSWGPAAASQGRHSASEHKR